MADIDRLIQQLEQMQEELRRVASTEQREQEEAPGETADRSTLASTTIEVPARLENGRDAARQLLDGLPLDLSGQEVVVDWSKRQGEVTSQETIFIGMLLSSLASTRGAERVKIVGARLEVKPNIRAASGSEGFGQRILLDDPPPAEPADPQLTSPASGATAPAPSVDDGDRELSELRAELGRLRDQMRSGWRWADVPSQEKWKVWWGVFWRGLLIAGAFYFVLFVLVLGAA